MQHNPDTAVVVPRPYVIYWLSKGHPQCTEVAVRTDLVRF